MFKTSQSAKKSIHFFLPVFDKYSEFDQTGILRLTQIFTIMPSYIKMIVKKKLCAND